MGCLPIINLKITFKTLSHVHLLPFILAVAFGLNDASLNRAGIAFLAGIIPETPTGFAYPSHKWPRYSSAYLYPPSIKSINGLSVSLLPISGLLAGGWAVNPESPRRNPHVDVRRPCFHLLLDAANLSAIAFRCSSVISSFLGGLTFNHDVGIFA